MFKLLKNMDKKNILILILCVVLIFIQVWLDLKLPDYMTEITRLVQTEGSEMSDILAQGGWMLACAFGSLVSAMVTGFFLSLVSARFTKKIRKKLFSKVEEFSMEEIKKFSTSSLITRTTNDITNIQIFISMGAQMIIKAPILAVWAVIKILNKSWQWTALTGGALIIVMLYILAIVLIVLPKFKKVQKLVDNMNNVTRENLSGIRVVRAFNAEEYQEEKFEKANDDLTQVQLFTQRATSTLSPFLYVVMYVLTLGIYFIGAYLLNGAGLVDKLDVFSNMIVFSTYALQVLMAFVLLALVFVLFPRAQISANRINEVLDTNSKIKDGKSDKGKEKSTVEFKNVSFKYPDGQEYVIKDISFKANKGETVAFIGATGSGKSTLVNLIPRFYDVSSGEILVDGINVKEYSQEVLHDKLGYVPQKVGMFGGTIKENVSYGLDDDVPINDKDLMKALDIAQATEFVEELEGKTDFVLAQGATNLSGGQKQRLSIARAIMKNPEIFIFDDTFSALDYKTDLKLRNELKKHTKNATKLIVAQRIGTIMNADKIIVLDEGRCVGQGTHKELLENCEVYKEIALSQLSKEELENGQ